MSVQHVCLSTIISFLNALTKTIWYTIGIVYKSISYNSLFLQAERINDAVVYASSRWAKKKMPEHPRVAALRVRSS